MSLSESADSSQGCVTLPVEFVHREGGSPSYQLVFSSASRALANRIDLVSDDFRWFLYVAGVHQGDYPSHEGVVIALQAHDSPKRGLILAVVTEKCRADMSDVGAFGECDPCYMWQLQGRERDEWAAVANPPKEIAMPSRSSRSASSLMIVVSCQVRRPPRAVVRPRLAPGISRLSSAVHIAFPWCLRARFSACPLPVASGSLVHRTF